MAESRGAPRPAISRGRPPVPATDRKEIRVPGMPEPVSHYTDVVRAGRMVFVSGCVAC